MRNIFAKSQYPSNPTQLVPVRQPSLVALASSKLERIPELWRVLFFSTAPQLVTQGHVMPRGIDCGSSEITNESWLKRNAWLNYNLVNCTQIGPMHAWLATGGGGSLGVHCGPHACGPILHRCPTGRRRARPWAPACHMNRLSRLLCQL